MRNYDAIVCELKELQSAYTPFCHEHTVISALVWGYSTARTIHPLELVLASGSLPALVDEVSQAWGGQDYVAGALRAAQDLYRRS